MSHVATGIDPDCEVMASVDEQPDGEARFLIADLCRDGAWMSMPADDAPSVAEYR